MHSFVQNIELFRNIVFCSIQLVVIAAAAAVIFLENVIIFPIDFFLCYYTLISIVAGLGWAGGTLLLKLLRMRIKETSTLYVCNRYGIMREVFGTF